MPRVSEKQSIIKWFLKSIESQVQHKDSESLWEALEYTYFSDSEDDFNRISSSPLPSSLSTPAP